jgi:hypothetical protein
MSGEMMLTVAPESMSDLTLLQKIAPRRKKNSYMAHTRFTISLNDASLACVLLLSFVFPYEKILSRFSSLLIFFFMQNSIFVYGLSFSNDGK